VVHPVRSAPWWASIAAQRGNADDALMTRRHGRDWYRRAGAARGRRPAHLAVTATAATALMQAVLRRRRSSAVASALWLAGTAQFAWARIAPGPRDAGEVARMAATSVAIPPVATAQWIRGLWQHRDVPRWRPRVAAPAVRAVLFDRDGTLVHDVPYNGRPELVRPVPGAREALARLRSAGVLTAVITNQSGVGRGLIERADVDAVNARVDELLGPFDSWQVCPHVDGDGCSCRKPRPGLVAAAARDLGVEVSECAVVGDTGADVAAGEAAGVALSVLVPNEVTLPSEIGWARYTARNLAEVVDLVLDDRVGNQEAVA
jgi:histidinol-phosphate phosphatase family protein